MIYLDNIQVAQVVKIPNKSTGHRNLVFKAVSTIDLVEYINQAVTDDNSSSLYYVISVSIPGNLPNGEYNYILESDGQVLSTGVMSLGDLSRPNEYERQTTYTQYEQE